MKGIGGFSLRGMTLIEVLVALLVLGIGVMGYAALQLRSVKMTEGTYDRSQAMAIAQDAMERIRANNTNDALLFYRGNAWTTGTNTAPDQSCTITSAVPTSDDKCTSVQVATEDIYQSRQMVETMLPNGSISVQSCDKLTCVYVAWNQATAAPYDAAAKTGCKQDDIQDGDRGAAADCVILEFIP